MTKKDYLIEKLTSSEISNDCFDKDTIEKVYEIVNTRDWAIFCSEMGDYDHPAERVAARETFKQEILKISENKTDSEKSQIEVLVKAIENSSFYHENFHSMDEEYAA